MHTFSFGQAGQTAARRLGYRTAELSLQNGFNHTGTNPSVALNSTAQAAWLAALGLTTETIYETSDITVKRWGRLVMVHCHGIYATPSSGNAWASIDLSEYRPSYNVSAIVAESTANGHIARLWVNATDGKVYLNAIDSTAASRWYGTLTYIY